MRVVYAQQPFPDEWFSAVFLGGPTPRGEGVESWRPQALEHLRAAGFTGVVLVPEPEDGVWVKGPDAYLRQVEWEKQGLELADVILFWVPRDMDTMPALTTQVEFGRYVTSGKVILGAPPWAASVKYLAWMQADVNALGMHDSLEGTVRASLARIEDLTQVRADKPAVDADALAPGAEGTCAPVVRRGGERAVPLHVWMTASFQAWHQAQRGAGNRLDDARLLWHFAPGGRVFAWALWVKVWIAAEERHKENEFVLARTDISTVVLYQSWMPDQGTYNVAGLRNTLLATEVVLVREFRSPARTLDGYIRELPGGSSLKPGHDPLRVASDEVHEETGLIVPADRFRALGSRQVAGTLSSHHAHLFAAELTASEMAQARKVATANKVHGVVEDSERTFVEVTTLGRLLAEGTVDWSVLGMVAQAVLTDG